MRKEKNIGLKMQGDIKNFIKKAILNIIHNTSNKQKLNKLIKTHKKKIHFIPIRYRIFGGLLQSMNIQFGNFIEILLHIIVETKKRLKGNIYLPEKEIVYRGDRLFNEFFTIKYSKLDYIMANIGEDKDIIELFDNLYNKIRNKII